MAMASIFAKNAVGTATHARTGGFKPKNFAYIVFKREYSDISRTYRETETTFPRFELFDIKIS